jgi:hypothetical protein
MSKMASHWSFGHLQLKLWAKEGPGVKLVVWLPTTKSRESTCSWRALRECDTALESSLWGLQDLFRPRRDPKLGRGVMAVQSPGSPTGTHSGQFRDSISGLHFGSPGKMWHLDATPVEWRRVRWWLTPESGPWWVLCVQVPVAYPNTQGCPEC